MTDQQTVRVSFQLAINDVVIELDSKGAYRPARVDYTAASSHTETPPAAVLSKVFGLSRAEGRMLARLLEPEPAMH
jgi:hypothetical protein